MIMCLASAPLASMPFHLRTFSGCYIERGGLSVAHHVLTLSHALSRSLSHHLTTLRTVDWVTSVDDQSADPRVSEDSVDVGAIGSALEPLVR